MEPVEYLARCIRGLEWVLAAEVSVRLGGLVDRIGHREVFFRAPLSLEMLTIGSADDLFIVVGIVDGVQHTRDGLQFLADRVKLLPLSKALETLAFFRRVTAGASMEVIASFLGKRNYSRSEIEDAIGAAIASAVGIKYTPHEHASRIGSEITWRVHIRDRQAVLGLRLASATLHRRDWRLDSRPGSLHPPVAFAMAMLADLRPGMTCLDPFCGTGTILIEAQHLQREIRLIGSDIDAAALAAASANAARAHVQVEWVTADAAQLPYPDHTIDRVVTNLPWGRAVRHAGALQFRQRLFIRELQRVLTQDGQAVLLTTAGVNVDSSPSVDSSWNTHTFKIRVSGRLAKMSVIQPYTHAYEPSELALALTKSWRTYRALHEDLE